MTYELQYWLWAEDTLNGDFVRIGCNPFRRTVSTTARYRMWFNWPLPNADGVELITAFASEPSATDQVIAGVLADWLEEQRQALVEGADGPTDPTLRLDELIRFLRGRFAAHYDTDNTTNPQPTNTQ